MPDVDRKEVIEFLKQFPRSPQKGGKLYLEIKYRLAALHQFYPNAKIESGSQIIPAGALGPNSAAQAVATATVTPDAVNAPNVSYQAQAMHAATVVAADFVANANTSAIGRAIALAGIGTELVADFDEEKDGQGHVRQMAEAPFPQPQVARQAQAQGQITPIRPGVQAVQQQQFEQPAGDVLTERQGKAIYAMTMAETGDTGITRNWLGDTRNLTRQQASNLIDYLNARKQAGLVGTGDLPEVTTIFNRTAPAPVAKPVEQPAYGQPDDDDALPF